MTGDLDTDQGSQFTSSAFTGLLKARNIHISMDGKGALRDNVFVERLWKSVKYEEVYLKAYESVFQAREGLARYVEFYNHRRPHSSLDRMTPEQFYFKSLPYPRRRKPNDRDPLSERGWGVQTGGATSKADNLMCFLKGSQPNIGYTDV